MVDFRILQRFLHGAVALPPSKASRNGIRPVERKDFSLQIAGEILYNMQASDLRKFSSETALQ